jgi:hypothetical protein
MLKRLTVAVAALFVLATSAICGRNRARIRTYAAI